MIQESLTNVIRHARAARARVEITYAPTGVDILVTDDGVGELSGRGIGHGLIGMRERVTSLHGRFTARNGRDGGFAVAVHLPADR